MIWLITLIYACAAAGGLYLLSHLWRNKAMPQNVAHIHGAVAAIATAFLAYYCYSHADNPRNSLIIFLLVACGGLYMMFQDRAKKQFPKFVPYVHAGFALVGFLLLVTFVFTM